MISLYGYPPAAPDSTLVPSSVKQSKPNPHLADVVRIMRAAGPTDIHAVVVGMCNLCMDYYRTSLRSVYADTVRMLQATPQEPVSEIFNAFDHFARATEVTSRIGSIAAQGGSDISGELPTAFLEIERARLHIAVAVFYCHEHMLVYLRNRLADEVQRIMAKLSSRKAADKQFIHNVRMKLADLDQRVGEVRLSTPRVHTVARAVREITRIEKKSEQLCALLNEHMRVTLDVHNRFDAFRQTLDRTMKRDLGGSLFG
jgi:hypothetical protein